MSSFNSFAIILVVGMCVTGSLNTLSGKLVNVTSATGLFGYYTFNHPFVQTAAMFLGESLCLAVYFLKYWRNKKSNENSNNQAATGPVFPFPFYIFAIPALCDLTATSVMNVGLVLTYASVFQMMRGSVVIFTGILSYFVFGRKLTPHKILGMFFILVGLACVGSAAFLSGSSGSGAPYPLPGALLVVAAQIIVAIQMVIEEKLMDKHDVDPLLVPGLEGSFGLSFMSIILIIMYQMPHFIQHVSNDESGDHFENSLDAFAQFKNSYVIGLGLSGYVCSIAFFNYFGVSVTKYMNATSRMVLDNIRTIVIWGVDLIIGWETFQYMQIVGFILLLTGTGIYKEIFAVPIAYFDYRLLPEYQKLQVQDGAGAAGDKEGGNSDVEANKVVNGSNGSLHQPLMNQTDDN